MLSDGVTAISGGAIAFALTRMLFTGAVVVIGAV